MGVDLSVNLGVGFVIPPEVLKEFVDKNDDDGDYGESEVIEELVAPYDKIQFFTGGSYYDDGRNNRTVICVKRLTERFGGYSAPGGVYGAGMGPNNINLTDDELSQLAQVAERLGIKDTEMEISSYLGLLWH